VAAAERHCGVWTSTPLSLAAAAAATTTITTARGRASISGAHQ